jgi:branched-chain amino acid transport system substrate-binding protein
MRTERTDHVRIDRDGRWKFRRGRWLLALPVLALAVAAAGCGGSDSSSSSGDNGTATGDQASSGAPIKVGVSLPLTGPLSVPGSNFKQSYQLCADLINNAGGIDGRKLKLEISDNRSDPQTAVNQTQRFISSDNVDILFGTFSTLLSFPIEAITEQNKMVYLEPADSAVASHSRGFKYNFGFTLKPIDYIGQSPVDAIFALKDRGDIAASDLPKTAAVVYQDDFFPNSIERGLLGGKASIPGSKKSVDFGKGYLADKGIKVVFEQQYPGDFNDWISLANSIKRSGADYLFALTQNPTEVNIVRALATVKYKPKGAFFSQGTYDQFQKSLGARANGVIVWSTWSPTVRWKGLLNGKEFSNQDFVKAFTAKYGTPPDEDHAQAFTVCQAADQAIRATGGTDNTKIRDWLAARTAADPVKTVQGDYHFDETGLTADRDVLLLQWQNGKLKPIYPIGPEYPGTVKIIWPDTNW